MLFAFDVYFRRKNWQLNGLTEWKRKRIKEKKFPFYWRKTKVFHLTEEICLQWKKSFHMTIEHVYHSSYQFQSIQFTWTFCLTLSQNLSFRQSICGYHQFDLVDWTFQLLDNNYSSMVVGYLWFNIEKCWFRSNVRHT